MRRLEVLARSLVDEPGYRTCGEDYWLVAHSPSTKQVSWVSTDYVVYCDPAEGFDVSAEALGGLPGAPPLLWPDDDEDRG